MKRSTKNDRLKDEAKRTMWLYYKENKSWLPKWIREYRDEIIEQIQAGKTAENVFNGIIDRVENDLVAQNAA